MNLYKVSRTDEVGYDEYDSMVVSAKTGSDALKIHPSPFSTHITDGKWMGTYSGGKNSGGEYEQGDHDWVPFSEVHNLEVELLGETTRDRGVILASFNAG